MRTGQGALRKRSWEESVVSFKNKKIISSSMLNYQNRFDSRNKNLKQNGTHCYLKKTNLNEKKELEKIEEEIIINPEQQVKTELTQIEEKKSIRKLFSSSSEQTLNTKNKKILKEPEDTLTNQVNTLCLTNFQEKDPNLPAELMIPNKPIYIEHLVWNSFLRQKSVPTYFLNQVEQSLCKSVKQRFGEASNFACTKSNIFDLINLQLPVNPASFRNLPARFRIKMFALLFSKYVSSKKIACLCENFLEEINFCNVDKIKEKLFRYLFYYYLKYIICIIRIQYSKREYHLNFLTC